MKELFQQLLDRYGQSLTLTRTETGESLAVRAFLQPLLKERQEPPVTPTPLGAVCDQRWLYLGSGDVPLSPGDRVDWEALSLTVQEAQPLYLGDSLVYYRAVLRRRKEAAV